MYFEKDFFFYSLEKSSTNTFFDNPFKDLFNGESCFIKEL